MALMRWNRALLSIFCLLLGVTLAAAQTNPGFTPGPLKSAQLNAAFAAKADISILTKTNLFTTQQNFVTVGVGSGFVTSAGQTVDSLLEVNANISATPGVLPSGTIIHVVGATGVAGRILLDAVGNGGGFSPNFTCRRADGTLAVPSAVQSGEAFCTIAALGYGATSYSSTSRAGIIFSAGENWSDTAQGSYIQLLNTPTGSTTITERMRIFANGNIGIGTTLDPGTVTLPVLSFGNGTNIGVAGQANLIRLFDSGSATTSYGFGMSSSALNIVTGSGLAFTPTVPWRLMSMCRRAVRFHGSNPLSSMPRACRRTIRQRHPCASTEVATS
jgi:hypothetical protein